MSKTTMLAILLFTAQLCGCHSREELIFPAAGDNAGADASVSAELNGGDTSDSADRTDIFGNNGVSGDTSLTDRTEELLGKWYNESDLSEEWVFTEDKIVTIGGEKHDFSAKWSFFGGRTLKIDDTVYGYYKSDYFNSIELYSEDYETEITLISESSDVYETAKRGERLKNECGELFERFPDSDEWTRLCDCGDIPFLADADYIERSVKEGFTVSTPEELASFCYYVNTQPGAFTAMILVNDIDLSGYEWAPMGWNGGMNDHPFTCMVDGNGHSIKNMTIDSDDTDVGFIGWETYCYVRNITFENANVTGGGNVGIAAGQAIGGTYENVSVSGTVNGGSSAGSMLGWDVATKRNCTADVTVNGEKFDFLSYNEKAKSEIVIEDPVTITIDENHTVTRPEVEGYYNLGWMVFYNGEQVLHRNAENEYSYTYFLDSPGTYEIYLTAFVSGQYVPISNTVTYTIE